MAAHAVFVALDLRAVVAAGLLGLRWTLTLHGHRLVPLIYSAYSLLAQTKLAKHLGERSSVEHKPELVLGVKNVVVFCQLQAIFNQTEFLINF